MKMSFSAYREQFLSAPDCFPEEVQRCLDKIEAGKALNAFCQVYTQESLAQAVAIGRQAREGQAGPLAGMVLGLKDLFCYRGHPVTASSKILEGFVSQIDSMAVERLLAAGGVVIGHQTCDEFGMGSTTENCVYGRVGNPAAPGCVPGGSSGGSAAAVAAGMCHVALGTDTGGSVRQPAAFCDIIGLKPTYGRISRYGVIAYASSFDTVGIFSRTIEDCARVLEVIAGKDPRDTTSSSRPVPAYASLLEAAPRQWRVAYLEETLSHPAVASSVSQATRTALTALAAAGHAVAEAHFPFLDYALPTYYVLTPAEASANLARYDGIRYGHRAAGVRNVRELYARSRTEGFGKEVQRRLLLGTFVLSSGYHDAYYVHAQRVRQLLASQLTQILKQHDFIILPTTPTPPFPFDHQSDPVERSVADLFTVLASLAGLPAISIPNGYDAAGLPIGLQIIGRAFEEERLLAFAHGLLKEKR